jgi:hypothetical protein
VSVPSPPKDSSPAKTGRGTPPPRGEGQGWGATDRASGHQAERPPSPYPSPQGGREEPTPLASTPVFRRIILCGRRRNLSPPPETAPILSSLRPTKGAVARHRAAGWSGGVRRARPLRVAAAEARPSPGKNAREACRPPDGGVVREPRAGRRRWPAALPRHLDIDIRHAALAAPPPSSRASPRIRKATSQTLAARAGGDFCAGGAADPLSPCGRGLG